MSERKFEVGQKVLYQDYNQGDKWVPATITGQGLKNGQIIYGCQLDKASPSRHSGKQWGYEDQFKK